MMKNNTSAPLNKTTSCGPVNNKKGFALIEILIAVTILSIVVVSLYSGVSNGILAITRNKNLTHAILIAKSKLIEFKNAKMRGTDLKDEEIKEYPNFTFDRVNEKFEHIIFGPIPAKKATITVKWKEGTIQRKYSLSYIYAESYGSI